VRGVSLDSTTKIVSSIHLECARNSNCKCSHYNLQLMRNIKPVQSQTTAQ
jgi:hypothetical protein